MNFLFNIPIENIQRPFCLVAAPNVTAPVMLYLTLPLTFTKEFFIKSKESEIPLVILLL